MIIGLGYQARVGKDTVADYLSIHHGFHKRAFADKLKEDCAQVFGLTLEHFQSPLKEEVLTEWKMTPREVIQRFGQMMKAHWGDYFWVDRMHEFLGARGGFSTEADRRDWVITDVRFRVEAEAIKSWGGIVVHVDGERREQLGGNAAAHISEHELDGWKGWDYELTNHSDIPDLYARVEVMMNRYSK